MKTQWLVRQMALSAVLFTLSCSSDGCSCDGFVVQDFPVEKAPKTIPTSGEVRLTSSGVQYLSDNLPTIVDGFLPNGLNFCVPATSFSGVDVCHATTCASTGATGCDLTMEIDSAKITPVPTDTLEVDITIGGLDDTLNLRTLGSNCTMRLHSAADETLPATFGAMLPVTFTVDQASPFKDVRVEIGDFQPDTTNIGYDIDPVNIWDFPVCEGIDGIAANNFVRDLLLSQLEVQFAPLIASQVDAALCKTCETESCPNQTVCDEDNICRYQDESCAQNLLGLAGQLQLGALLASYSEEPNAAVDMTVRAADHAVVDTGLTIGLRSGYDPVEQAICVPVDPTVRDFAPTPISPTLSGNARPNGTPFHFGLGYHKKALESMLWSVWGSGATCFKVGTDSIDLITTGAFGTLLPSIRKLTYGKSAAAYVKIVPQQPPKVILGANDLTPSGNTYTINDPLMTIDWKDFDVHIYGYAQDRYTRLLTVRVDLLLPIGLAADGMGGIIPIIGDLDDAFTNQRVIGAELVAEDPQRILDLLPTLIGLALPSLTGALNQPISLPEFFGFRVDIGPGDITSIDNNTSIAIFGDLETVQMPVITRLDTVIKSAEVDLGRTSASGLILPEIDLEVMPLTSLATAGELAIEYSWRVDSGPWSHFVRSNELRVDSPLLVLPGEHLVEVRARRVGEPYTVDATPAHTRVVVDWENPQVELTRDGTVVRAVATDVVDDAAELEVRWRIATGTPGSTWSPWTSSTQLDLAARELPERVRVFAEVRDRAGNVGAAETTVTLQQDLQPTTPSSASDAAPRAGCNSAGDDAPVGLLWVSILGLGFLVVRRRRRTLNYGALGVAAVLTVGACKCGDDPPATNEACTPACDEGQQCIDRICVTPVECSTGEDCPDGEECAGGQCVPEPTCEERCDCKEGDFAVCDSGSCECVPYCDGGCGEGEFCCQDSNSCEALPDPCADQVCDPGFAPAVQTDASADEASCEITAGTCECEELPPLPLGWHGHWAAIARNAGVTAVAAYNSTYTDLMVGVIDANLQVAWQFVDGVPATGDVRGSLNGPRGGIADKGDDVGRYTSIAIDDAGTLHVFYRDETRGVLKYARGAAGADGYTFELSDLDTQGDTGYWTSAVHLDGKIHVVWTTKAIADGADFASRLQHMTFDASGSPADPTATMESVATGAAAHPCGADCETAGEECFAAAAVCAAPSTDCADACADGTACYMGSCVATYDEPPLNYGYGGLGSHAQLTTTPTGGLLLVYWDPSLNSVAYARWDGSWGMPNLIGTGSGPWASGMVDANDEVHLAWMDTTVKPPVLIYQNVTADAVAEVVQDGIRDTAAGWMVNDIGEDVDLRVGTDGKVTLVYHDATSHVLRLATKAAGGTWQLGDLAVPGNPYSGAHGFYAAMLALPDTQFVVELSIDQQLDPTEANPVFHE